MPRDLPLLPLRSSVLLPGAIVREHVSRPEVMRAIEHHVDTGQPLLVVSQMDPSAEDLLSAELTAVATLSRAVKVVRLGDGTARLLLEGLERHSIDQVVHSDAGLLMAQGSALPDRVLSTEQVHLLARKLKESLERLHRGRPEDHPSLVSVLELDLSPSRLADHAVANLSLPHPERLAYLSEPVVDHRLAQAVVDVERELVLRGISSEVAEAVQSKLDTQQRDWFLREQIRGLQDQLGGADGPRDEVSALEEKLRTVGLSDEALTEVLREVARLNRMHPDASEYHVARTWLDWVANMPWDQLSEDSTDLAQARRVLNSDHYGLQRVKDRILEYLAVRILNPTGRGPVLCLVGPPGVGKTSLGRSVASALGRNFQRISLGGMKDEAEIRGHRRTYVGALPGRIVHALKKSGTRNPVILLDEIDKLGKDLRGDPAAALLEVLDPEQNTAFTDHYLDIPVDLSQVLFICTANRTGPIPSALRDRLEITEVSGYTEEEKLEITRRHLLRRLREAHGLTARQVQIAPHAVRQVIRSYTREAGVRGLEQRLAALHRKAARKFVEGRRRSMRIAHPHQVRALLGPATYFPDLADPPTQAGVAVGLAWTEAGGDVLFVEATRWSGTGEALKITGQLGAVMKESVETALSLVRSRTEQWGIPSTRFRDSTIHVHVPAGAVPKDGPSAGITIVVSLVSLLTGRLARAQTAMTGEVTLRGRVLPVGGVKEKVLAARRAGVRRVLLPAENAHDLEDIPQALLADLKVHLIRDVSDLIELTLEPLSDVDHRD